jgi:hypothetical protein
LLHTLVMIKYNSKYSLHFVNGTSQDEVWGPDGQPKLLLHLEGVPELVPATHISNRNPFENCALDATPEEVRELQRRLEESSEQMLTAEELALAMINVVEVERLSTIGQTWQEQHQGRWKRIQEQLIQRQNEWKFLPDLATQRNAQHEWQWQQQVLRDPNAGWTQVALPTPESLEVYLTSKLVECINSNRAMARNLSYLVIGTGQVLFRTGPPFLPARIAEPVAAPAPAAAGGSRYPFAATPQQPYGARNNSGPYYTPYNNGRNSGHYSTITLCRSGGRFGGMLTPTDLPAPPGVSGNLEKSASPAVPHPRTEAGPTPIQIKFSDADKQEFGIVDSPGDAGASSSSSHGAAVQYLSPRPLRSADGGRDGARTPDATPHWS